MSDRPREGLSHTRRIEVSWGDCDAAGIVFYPRYYAWFDAGTHALLAAAGLDHRTLRDRYGVVGASLVQTSARFASPATYDDVLTATSRVVKIGRSSFTVSHRLLLGDRLVTEGEETRVWVEPSADAPHGMRAAAIPDAVRAVLAG
ncbi:MAG: thioesterase family protein [bacterium]|nr:acyl-CoA thioesterase [Myxococcales bacterium]MCB9542684.1 acyl-CoA thioesterase [Myxococcales bacterium]MCB9552864.1 acyl-CoA thioesterase [Myxococcales bacterium]